MLHLETPKRPKTVSSNENLLKLPILDMSNWRSRMSQLATYICIPKTTIYSKLIEDVGMKKTSARWVLNLLLPSQKLTRIICAKEMWTFPMTIKILCIYGVGMGVGMGPGFIIMKHRRNKYLHNGRTSVQHTRRRQNLKNRSRCGC